MAEVADLGARNCPACLVPMVEAGTEEKPYWQCPSCRLKGF